MTAPRQVLPGTTYLVTRRCTQRQFLLKPSETTNDVLLFVLATAAQRYGIKLHAFCVMSNHFHLVVTDPNANLPAFHQFLDALVARAVNSLLGRWENFWAPDSYSAVRLTSARDIVEKTAYVLANPVAAALVRTARLWPGVWSDPDKIGARLEIRRPRQFFAANGVLPETVSLEITHPPAFSCAAEFVAQVSTALGHAESAARERVGKGFLGVEGVLKGKTYRRPGTIEPRRKLNPRIAARDVQRRIAGLAELAEFVRAYKAAWAARRRGDPAAVFPAGTYQLRIWHGVACAEAG